MMLQAETDFDRFLLLVGKLNYAWTNTESLLIHVIAGLAKVDSETATIIFLTLNTSRARLDLVQRLAKRAGVASAERQAILDVTARIQKIAQLRNRYNHCIYAFDANSELSHTILMRIADRKDAIKMGQAQPVDAQTADDIRAAITELQAINTTVWSILRTHDYPMA